MTVEAIIMAHLKEHGFDGLFNADGDCACVCADIAPCDGNMSECEPGVISKVDSVVNSWRMCPKADPGGEAVASAGAIRTDAVPDDPAETPKDAADQRVCIPLCGVAHEPLFWWQRRDLAGKVKTYITCLKGHIATLEAHTIFDDGRVQPAVQCPGPDCDFHAWIRLVDWKSSPGGEAGAPA